MDTKNYYRQVNEKCIELLQHFGFSRDIIKRFCLFNNFDDAMMFFSETIEKLPDEQKTTTATELITKGILYIDDVICSVWLYNRSLHFYLDSIPNMNVIDTTILDRNEKDFFINLNFKGKPYSVHASSRATEQSIGIRNASIKWSFSVYDNTVLDRISFSSDDSTKNDLNNSLLYYFHVETKQDVRRLYIDPNYKYAMEKDKYYCGSCTKCQLLSSCKFRNEEVALVQYSIKYKDNNPICLLHKNNLPTPADVLKCAIHALECYENREVILKKRNKKKESYEECKVHVANASLGDKIVMLPLHEYAAECKESQKHESKGGHHASPVAHTRRGFFRRSRKRGDYILQDGEFIYVGGKKGNYSFVNETTVNAHSDRVIIYQSPNE
jgi:hypothetical protein